MACFRGVSRSPQPCAVQLAVAAILVGLVLARASLLYIFLHGGYSVTLGFLRLRAVSAAHLRRCAVFHRRALCIQLWSRIRPGMARRRSLAIPFTYLTSTSRRLRAKFGFSLFLSSATDYSDRLRFRPISRNHCGWSTFGLSVAMVDVIKSSSLHLGWAAF